MTRIREEEDWTPKIQGGGNPPSWKAWIRHISTKNHLILMKCGIWMQIRNSVTVTWQNVNIFKIQDGCRFKNHFGYNSAANCLILVKFCTGEPVFHRTSVMGQISAFCRTYFSYS